MSQKRPQVSPNAGFMARLIRLEESLHGTKTVKVHAMCRLPVLAAWAAHLPLLSPLLSKLSSLQDVCLAMSNAGQEDQARPSHLPSLRRQDWHLPAVAARAHSDQAS